VEPRISIIGIGNTLMGDDGVGVRIAEELDEVLGAEVTVVTGFLAGMALMPHVLSADVVIFLDALAAGDEPGSIYRFDPDDAGITNIRSTTSHGMGIPYLITNSRLQGHSPEFLVFAVHIGDVMCGPDTLTPAVSAAVPRVVELVQQEIERVRRKATA
jgi:hydrogenase maturation protease